MDTSHGHTNLYVVRRLVRPVDDQTIAVTKTGKAKCGIVNLEKILLFFSYDRREL